MAPVMEWVLFLMSTKVWSNLHFLKMCHTLQHVHFAIGVHRQSGYPYIIIFNKISPGPLGIAPLARVRNPEVLKTALMPGMCVSNGMRVNSIMYDALPLTYLILFLLFRTGVLRGWKFWNSNRKCNGC